MTKPRIKLQHTAKSVVAVTPQFGAAAPYDGGASTEALMSFNPVLGSADGDLLRDRDTIAARSRALSRNNGWAAGGAAKEVDAVIGANFRPISKPDHAALGILPEAAAELGRAIDSRWRAYADDPRCMADASRQLTLSQQFALAYRHYLVDGDAVGVIQWKEDRPTRTTLRIVDPDLMGNPDGRQDEEFLRGGVEIDEDGAATAYNFRRSHERDPWAGVKSQEFVRWRRETPWGRPIIIHFFDKLRDGQSRGVSRFAPIIEKLRMEHQYSSVELQAAVINAVLGAFIESPFDSDAILEMLGEGDGTLSSYSDLRSEYHESRKIRLAGARIPSLFPGEKIGVLSAARPAAQFADFEAAVLRQIASALGLSYEQLASDWSKTNYSSARAALVEIWRGWTARRRSFAQRFCQPFRMAWLEEEVDAGRIRLPTGAPDFYENWAAFARAKWIGPGKGFVDPVKEAQAAAMRVSLGVSTLEDEAAELTGSDLAENLVQISREFDNMPEGMLHPAQESFANLIGPPGGAGPAEGVPAS